MPRNAAFVLVAIINADNLGTFTKTIRKVFGMKVPYSGSKEPVASFSPEKGKQKSSHETEKNNNISSLKEPNKALPTNDTQLSDVQAAKLEDYKIQVLTDSNKTSPSKSPDSSCPTTLLSSAKSNGDDYCLDRSQLGGKGFFLQTMQQSGIPVPSFECITTETAKKIEAYSLSLAIIKTFFPDSTCTCIADIKETLRHKPPLERSEGMRQLAQLLKSDAFYQSIRETGPASGIRALYKQVSASGNHPVIARSSGVAEDRFGDAQAGKYDSYVKGKEDIVQTYLKVLASAWESHANARGSVPDTMAVIVQQCVSCQMGGVAMSHTSLDDQTIQITSAPGQPKIVVSGEYGVTPNIHSIHRTDKSLSTFQPGNTQSTFLLKENADGEGFYEEAVSVEELEHVSLSDTQVAELTGYIKQLEDQLLCPVDVEFGIDNNGMIFILQVRPITKLLGGMNFDINFNEPPVMTGQLLVNEGMCSGTLYHADGPSSPLQPGNIIIADHFQDRMLTEEFLQKANGFIFRDGGPNDHVAITLRQAGKPYFIAGEGFHLPDPKNPDDIYTMACGQFKSETKCGLWKGDHTGTLRQSMTSLQENQGIPELQNRTAVSIERNWSDPATTFEWLNNQNMKLLNYFAPDGVFSRCLSPKSVIAMSMSANRQQLIQALEEETNDFLEEMQAFLDGYMALMAFADAGEKDAELKTKKQELDTIAVQLNRLSKQVKQQLQSITQPFHTGQELPDAQIGFDAWQAHCNQLKNCLQTLSLPRSPDAIKSLHDIIFTIHRDFVKVLPEVSTLSGLGRVSKLEGNQKITIVDFVDADQPSMLNSSVTDVLANLDCNHSTVVNTKDALIITTALGYHKCVIESLNQGDGGKGRTVRVKFSDKLNGTEDGKRQRMLLASLVMEALAKTPLTKKINPSTHDLIIENTHLKSEQAQEEALLNAMTVLFSVRNLDLDLNRQELYRTSLSLPIMIEKIQQGLALSENAERLKFFLINRDNCEQFDYSEEYTGNIPFIKFSQPYATFHKLGIQAKIYLEEQEKLEEEEIYEGKASPAEKLLLMMKNKPETVQQNILIHLLSGNERKFMPFIKQYYPEYNNADFLKQALSLNTRVVRCIDSSIPEYHDCVIHALQHGKVRPHWIAKSSLKNPSIMKLLVAQDGGNLIYAPKELQNDKDIVLTAVKKSGKALEYASDALKADKEVVMAAIMTSPDARFHAHKRLKEDEDIKKLYYDVHKARLY